MTKSKIISVLLIIAICLLDNGPSWGQTVAEFDSPIKSLKGLYQLSDTSSIDFNTATINVIWMDSLIQLRFLTKLEDDLETARKWEKDPTYIPSEDEKELRLKFLKMSAQNCHSFALEKYFAYHTISDNVLFHNKSVLVNNKYMKYIISTAFTLNKSIDTKRKKNFKTEFTKGSLLVFRNKENWTIHTVFYDGQYHSKNGGWEAKSVDKLKEIYDSYWDTVVIEEYQIDMNKVNSYLKSEISPSI